MLNPEEHRNYLRNTEIEPIQPPGKKDFFDEGTQDGGNEG
jgi:hypothetical protein